VNDIFLPYLGSVAATVVLLCVVVVLIFELRRRLRKLDEERERLPAACRSASLREEVDQLSSERESLEGRVNECRGLLAQADVAGRWLDENLTTYEKAYRELPALQAETQLARDQRDQCVTERDAARDECDEIRSELQKLKREAGPAREMLERRQELEQWLAEWQPEYERLFHELQTLPDRVEELRDQIDGMETVLSDLAAQRRAAESERSFLEAENSRLHEVTSGQESELSRIRSETDTARAHHAGIQIELEQARAHRAAEQEELDTLLAQTADTRREVKRLKEQNEEFESERAAKLEDLKALDRLVKKLNADKRELEDEIEKSKARLEAELEQINQLISGAVARWEQLAPTVGVQGENRLAELWAPVLDRNQFAGGSRGVEHEQDSLDRTMDYLSGIGLRYDRRVINAFHTSLKVADMSPLVVLAGISGTGKSELPRRYAEGMGMHFLSLPVQPRWDSPQDMFGFYNYLENRYRATELARALVQMDRFFDDEHRGWNYPEDWAEHNLRDRMLLVLLDEMNLARVEYYFSEFLSRLETRRGIDPAAAGERRKAEISLEVGLQSLSRDDGHIHISQQPTLPLFVDTNVLFVGTMNEDESTQTLSDKVVDRANVLRFGRPARLQAHANGASVSPPDVYLPFAQWQTYIRREDDLRADIHGDVTRWGQTLNQAMQAIGRPFAHRTFAAMMAYVANYPEQSPEAGRQAMADQIELKLLPKFRGLDPQESSVRQALGTLQRIIEELDDQPLLAAVRQAARASEHQFAWNGLDRLEEASQ
jgi:predicted nuclease with TOPRIM domain